jgi:ubiquinone/menaquinone biosynthesis C-methylase UbiE
MEQDYYFHVRKQFGRLASVYNLTDIFTSSIRTKVVNCSDLQEKSMILDVATGTGKQAFAFGQKGHDVVGIDLSKPMLKIASRTNKYSNVRFVLADAANLPFEDAQFDLCCISLALHEMPSKIRQKVVQEMVRVTISGGSIIIIDYSSSPVNKIGYFFIHYIAKLFESKYYSEFINSYLPSLLISYGMEMTEEISLSYDIFKIFKFVKQEKNY